MNDAQADCQVTQDRRVQIRFPQVGTAFYILRVLGVTQPSPIYLPSAQASVWVSLIPDGIYNDTQYFTSIPEITPTYPLGTFNMMSTSIQSAGLRAGATHTLIFTPPV